LHLAIAVGLCTFTAPARADITAEELRKEPGYFDFGQLPEFAKDEPIVEVRLTQPLLGFAAAFGGEEDPELADMMKELKLVNVRVYRCDARQAESMRKQSDRWSTDLLSRKWEQIVKLTDGSERASVFVKMEAGASGQANDPMLAGLTVVAIGEDDEAVFVNVVGRFHFSQVSKLGRHFDLPHMDEMRDKAGSDSSYH
jgi:hypothetical protein